MTWVKVYVTADMIDAQIKAALLKDHDIAVNVINKTDSMYHFSSNSSVIELYTQTKDALKAKHLIEKSNE